MNKKNGFTLIELLAIIVILAIIAVITVPLILNIVEKSRQESIVTSAHGYKNAIQTTYLKKIMDSNFQPYNRQSYIIDSDGNMGNVEILATGKKPNAGNISINNNVISGCLQYDDYYVTIDKDEVKKAIKGECNTTELIQFSVDNINLTAEKDMTWTEWINSDYNTIGAHTVNTIYWVYIENGYHINANRRDKIIENKNYKSSYGGSPEMD